MNGFMMSELASWQVIIAWGLIWMFILSFVNGLYISLYGIKYMDRYFSSLRDYRYESESPFDQFSRMHKYCFLFVFRFSRPPVSRLMRAWLYITFYSLMCYWLVMLVFAADYYFDFIKV